MHLPCQKYLIENGQLPSDAVTDIAADKSIQVIAFGESHWWSNPQRELLKNLIEPLSRAGFTHLGLEIEQNYQGILNDFNQGKVNRENLESSLREAGASLFNPAGVPCGHFFAVIEKAKDCGIEVIAMDKNRDQWHSRKFAEKPRENFLVKRIENCLSAGKNNRAIVLSGNNHLYVREDSRSGLKKEGQELPTASNQLSMAEHLRDAGIKLISLAGIIYSTKVPDGLNFSSLYPITEGLKKTVLIDTNRFDSVIGKDRRCPWGACTDGKTNNCPGIKYNICQNFPFTEIRLNNWDKLIFFDSSWWNKTKKSLNL